MPQYWVHPITLQKLFHGTEFENCPGLLLINLPETETEEPTLGESESEHELRKDLEARYVQRYGRRPHPLTRLDRLKAAVEAP